MAQFGGKKKVIIIGAGSAGLGAARWLLDNDQSHLLEVLVIEGRNRPGGRVFTDSISATEGNHNHSMGLFDLGASWVHDRRPLNPMCMMARRLNCDLFPTDWDNAIAMRANGEVIPESKYSKAYDSFEKAMFKAARETRRLLQQGKPIPTSFEAMLQAKLGHQVWSDTLTQNFMADYDFLFGAPLYKISSTEGIDGDWLAAEDDDSWEDIDDAIFIKNGYADIILGLLTGEATDTEEMRPRIPEGSIFSSRGIDILYETKCIGVYQVSDPAAGSQQCIVRTQNTNTPSDSGSTMEHTADAVLVTVPLGVLKSRLIEFFPPLSVEKQVAIDAVGYGNVVKVVMEFPKVFWATHPQFLHIADNMFSCSCEQYGSQQRGSLTSFMNGFAISKKKILVGYGLGDAADQIEQMDNETLLQLIMQRMTAVAARGKTPVPPIRVIRTRWGSDPFSYGAYSYNAVGHVRGLRSELRRREGSVWFAGEHVNESSLWHSCVHGAWQSGVLAAESISRDLQIPVITPSKFFSGSEI